MSNSDKVIIGGSCLMIATAGVIAYLTKRSESITSDITSRLINIQYTLNQCNTEITIGNKEIADAGLILRKLIKNAASENIESKNDGK